MPNFLDHCYAIRRLSQSPECTNPIAPTITYREALLDTLEQYYHDRGLLKDDLLGRRFRRALKALDNMKPPKGKTK